MKLKEAIPLLERAWAEEGGALFRLRLGQLDELGTEDLLRLLRAIEAGEDPLPRRGVALVWYMPLFIRWQAERVEPHQLTMLQELETNVTTEVERVLGVP